MNSYGLSRQRKKMWLQGRLVYPLPTHYSQTWQHLPDHGAYHRTLIANHRLVQTGLDLVRFSTVVFYEPEYSLYTSMIRKTLKSDCVMVFETVTKRGCCVFWNNTEDTAARRAMVPETDAKRWRCGECGGWVNPDRSKLYS